ncbi:MAG: TonB-dependent receptor, partial [Gammaproteobacteria bacterium]
MAIPQFTVIGWRHGFSRTTINRIFTRTIAASLAAAPFSAAAQSVDEIYRLGEIVVMGEQPGVEAVGTVYEVTAGDIERKAARTLDEAIELLPGVNVRTAADGTPRIDIRGFRTRHVKLLLNGVPFNSSFDAQFDPTLIPTEYIAKIKLSSGPSSEIYGDGGLSAVINIVTKKGYQGIHGKAAGEIGDGSHHRAWGSLSGGVEQADFFISLSQLDRNGWPMADNFSPTPEENGGLRNNSDRKRDSLYLNTGYKPNEDWSLGLTFNHLSGEFGKPASVINDPSDPFANNPRYERAEDEKVYASQFTAEYDPEGPWSTRNW